ncbi:hypothetical protein [Sphaerotilus microaerophilus]|uniref:Uncharacterized protein n=1 Tax=Sphaerotilus microaerophilus TaxID=2914710 RepID=A0ABM7YN84_9BURK|nr:hypothetical protein [Sphaerotilus sp. FB-5]BDI05914.1 hypothetical protein CATMQ487_28840 [Sphaerotilus sp. FB-5]
MSTITDLYRSRRAASVAHCDAPAPPCSRCGMLECLCRPRFFAGQVLTADDLNRLDAYIRAKHRLHNRQLHGWGVVNGLEVTCGPCGNGVTVSCGYALSPCGEDIVVCDSVAVDVCALIGHCMPELPPCDPPHRPNRLPCPEGEQEWVLAIRYAETPTRGVQPLYGSAPVSCGTGSGCGCGKAGCNGSGGCGCGGQSKALCPPPRPRGAPVQCEPTVVCEGYTFEVYRKPPKDTDDDNATDSPLMHRLQCCLEALIKGAPTTPDGSITSNPAGWQSWAVKIKAHLLLKLVDPPGTHCELIARLQSLAIPSANNPAALEDAIELLFVVAIDAMLNCLCSALLPPCPLPDPDGRVPLATLHISGGDCRVLRVCNWSTERAIAVTWPAIEYWLSPFPIATILRELLQRFCCFDLASIFRRDDDNGIVGVAGVADSRLNTTVEPSERTQAFARIFADTATAPDTSARALVQGLLGGKGDFQVRRADLSTWLLSQHLARPFATLAGLGERQRGGGSIDALEKRIADLDARVQAQQAEIGALRKAAMAAPPPAPAPAKSAKRSRK